MPTYRVAQVPDIDQAEVTPVGAVFDADDDGEARRKGQDRLRLVETLEAATDYRLQRSDGAGWTDVGLPLANDQPGLDGRPRN